mmetsp:Transcript_40879/g.123778  ORF Transcript_40879/g.123778 Transcript_40879/m.123778 type:complete len:221 (+) Transcript_40879:354-1016(+)
MIVMPLSGPGGRSTAREAASLPFATLATTAELHAVQSSSGGEGLRPQKPKRSQSARASQLPARTAASSSRPASTSVQSTFCRCVLVASCGGGRSWPRFDDERRTIVPPLFALCMSGQAAAGHYHRAALLQPDLAHCAQPPEHHHRPASCHGELLLRPLARLSRWHTLAICCSRSASSSFSALLPWCRHHTPSGRPEPRGLAGGGNVSTSLSGAPRAATAC